MTLFLNNSVCMWEGKRCGILQIRCFAFRLETTWGFDSWRKTIINWREAGKKMPLKQWPLIHVEFSLTYHMTYLCYCLSQCGLDFSLRIGIVMRVSRRKTLTLFFVNVIAFTLNLWRKSLVYCELNWKIIVKHNFSAIHHVNC